MCYWCYGLLGPREKKGYKWGCEGRRWRDLCLVARGGGGVRGERSLCVGGDGAFYLRDLFFLVLLVGEMTTVGEDGGGGMGVRVSVGGREKEEGKGEGGLYR